ncbi:MAG: methionine ABC transporter ATP-binding protein, partial [Lachnospiraceae bacterium]|nr:methionine ABC transporter ATP-binding protein [Lachnospiraceae bacterium]
GSAVEYGSTCEILHLPAHPYTIGILRSIPGPDKKGEPRDCNPGRVPSVHDKKDPCPFAPRCAMAKPICTMRRPPRADFEEGHYVFCHFANERQRSRWNNP